VPQDFTTQLIRQKKRKIKECQEHRGIQIICVVHCSVDFDSCLDPLSLMISKNSVPTSKKTHCVSITDISRLMMFRETAAVPLKKKGNT